MGMRSSLRTRPSGAARRPAHRARILAKPQAFDGRRGEAMISPSGPRRPGASGGLPFLRFPGGISSYSMAAFCA
jgi:hypothetical protein